jgi:two-component system sensor histidine kinase ArlS
MKKAIIEAIRKKLAQVILPIRKKKEEWLRNFRLSMAFRISMAYLKLLLIYGILFMVGFFFLYMYAEKEEFDRMAGDIIKSCQEQQGAIGSNPFCRQGLFMKITNDESKQVIFNDITFLPYTKRSFQHKIYFNTKGKSNIFLVIEKNKFTEKGIPYDVVFQYNMTKRYQRFLSLLWKMILLYLLMVVLIIRKGKKSDKKLFEPLRVMSAHANRLTVNNLHSERLNTEGTKNELKDLANVINAMLDRIEISYESQKQFVSDASHELRTPIAVIEGYINLLSRWGSENEEVLHESIDAIQNEAKSMQDLVEKLLYLSRHDKKTLKLTKKKFNMRPVVEDMVKETGLVTKDRIIQSPVLEDVVVYGDKQALKQAIRIFIDNAVKYTKDGDQITISCENSHEDCVITVQDTGIGMTKYDVDHIFNRFYRSDNVRSQNISGHGLGLSLAKLIILSHTGRIKVRSQFKKGTCFIITLPKRKF